MPQFHEDYAHCRQLVLQSRSLEIRGSIPLEFYEHDEQLSTDAWTQTAVTPPQMATRESVKV